MAVAKLNTMIMQRLRLISILISILLLSLTACTGLNPTRTELASPGEPDQQAGLIADYGIQARSLRLTAAGQMLDFRYKVLDAEKAAKVVKSKIHPYIIDEGQGNKIGVQSAKIGEMRHTGNNLKAGKQYFVLFGNPGRRLKVGDKVTIVMGDYRIQHMQVQ